MAQTCANCGREMTDKEYGLVRLKDGQTVCKDCADQARILYPYRYEKRLTQSELPTFVGKDSYKGTYHEDVILGFRIDPLEEMTLAEFRGALAEAQKAAEAQAARYAGAKAVIEADHIRKYYFNGGTEEHPRYTRKQVYGVFGKVVYGTLISGAEAVVTHRDREYSAKLGELQDWDGTSPGGTPIGQAAAGTLVNMVFMQDMSFVYPGDTLIVR